MSGLYNILFNVNALAGPLLQALHIDYKAVPRFRDCFLSEDGSSIIVYTRTGGGNRQEYADANEAMRQWPGYLRDEDDSFDRTYALFHFAVPEEIAKDCAMAIENGWGINPAKRWKETLDKMQRDPAMAKDIADRSGIGAMLEQMMGKSK